MKNLILIIFLLCATTTKIMAQDIENTTPAPWANPDDKRTNPEFPGGVEAFVKHIFVRMRSHIPKKKGTAIVMFVVEKDGTVKDASIVQSLDPKTDERIMAIIKRSVNWKPGTHNGEPVRVAYTVPVTFN